MTFSRAQFAGLGALVALGFLLQWAFLTGRLDGLFAPPLRDEKDNLVLTEVGFDDLPGWAGLDFGRAHDAFLRSCTKPEMNEALCVAAKDTSSPRAFFESHFKPHRAATDGGAMTGLLTGYYEPELSGSLIRETDNQVALLKRPADLVQVSLGAFREDLKGRRIAGRVEEGRLQPYDDRAALDLLETDNVIAYVDSAMDAFFLHIQGSGRVRLRDGSVLRVGYDGANGHPYRSIGRLLIEQGAIAKEDMSLPALKDWLRANPDEQQALFNQNPSYIFFRILADVAPDEGPIGSQAVPLTPMASLAVDPLQVPLGTPVMIAADDPRAEGERLQLLTIAQDTGGAIRGPLRADLFTGWDRDAEDLAGLLKQDLTMFVLLPRSAE